MRTTSCFIAVAMMALISPAMAAPCTPGQRADLAKLGLEQADIKRLCGNASALFEMAYNAKESGDLRTAQQLFEQGLRIEPGNELGQKYLAEVKGALASAQGNCKVFLVSEKIVTPYMGGCKDGLADGQGSYSVGDEYGTVYQVKGEFRDGKLNGDATITTTFANGYVWDGKGEYRENRPWNAIGVHRGPRLDSVIETRNGALFAHCRSDRQKENNCTDELRAMLRK